MVRPGACAPLESGERQAAGKFAREYQPTEWRRTGDTSGVLTLGGRVMIRRQPERAAPAQPIHSAHDGPAGQDASADRQTIAALTNASVQPEQTFIDDRVQPAYTGRNEATDGSPTWITRRVTVEDITERLRMPMATSHSLVDGQRPSRHPLTDFDIEEQEARMLSPMPRPASWQSPVLPAPASWLRRQVLTGFAGLALGLVILVPVALWAKGQFDPRGLATQAGTNLGLAQASTSRAERIPLREAPKLLERLPTPQPVQIAAAPPPAPVALVEAVAPERTLAALPTPHKPMVPHPATAARIRTEAVLNSARLLIKDDDIPAARKLLADEAVAQTPAAAMLLAESHDPYMLAVWGARSVKADTARAIELYGLALERGVEDAGQRMRALSAQ